MICYKSIIKNNYNNIISQTDNYQRSDTDAPTTPKLRG